MMQSHAYERPTGLSNLLRLMDTLKGNALPVAGGTDVLVAGRGGRHADKTLVDLTGVEALSGIREEDGNVVIGALTSFTALAQNELVRIRAAALAEGAASVGSPQIRNRGTVGGNICNASPAGDTLPALVALDASVRLASASGVREMKLSAFITGAYKTQRANSEILTEVFFPLPAPGTRSRYYKVGRRNALAISRLSLAALVRPGPDGAVAMAAFVPGALFDRPARLREAEAALVGKQPCESATAAAVAAAAAQMEAAVGSRWSAPYKLPVCQNLCRRAIEELAGT